MGTDKDRGFARALSAARSWMRRIEALGPQHAWVVYGAAMAVYEVCETASGPVQRAPGGQLFAAALLVVALTSIALAVWIAVTVARRDHHYARTWPALLFPAWALTHPGPVGVLEYAFIAGTVVVILRIRSTNKGVTRRRPTSSTPAPEPAAPRGTRREAGSHYTGKGTAKRGFPMKMLAERRAAELQRSDSHPMAVYRCATCNAWHVGRSHPLDWPQPCPICGRE